jgi:hypothetical protein
VTPPPFRQTCNAICSMLEDATGREVGWVRAPEGISTEADQLRFAYAIVYPLPAVNFDGPQWDDPEAIVSWPFQVTSFGWRQDQVQDLDDQLRDIWLSREANGRFTYPLDVDDVDELDRTVLEAGGYVYTEGTRLAVQSTYELKASRS